MESLDCIVIGAGWNGLAAAKQYRVTQPSHDIAIFDSQASIGGTWASERLYPGLKTNNIFGTYQFPDFPMQSGLHGAEEGKHIPGAAVHEYLKSYAHHFGLSQFIQLQTKIVSAEHQDTDGGWLVIVEHDGQRRTISTKRLIVATGLTSEPKVVAFKGQEDFSGKVFHGRDFNKNRDTVGQVKSATVYGSTKYAWDAVYAYASAGAEVHWIIRPSGHGSCWMTPPYVTPFKQRVEHLANMRFLTWMSPCIWGKEDGHPWARRFLHGTFIGRLLVDSFWKILSSDVAGLCDLDAHPETKKLKPKIEAMYVGNSFSILNYDVNFFDFIKSGQVRIYTSDIDHLSANDVHLSDGTHFETQSILAHTGWEKRPPLTFLPEGIEADLGLPHRKSSLKSDDLGGDEHLLKQADQEILRAFPRLRSQPKYLESYVPMAQSTGVTKEDNTADMTPFMLYRYIVPSSSRLLKHRDVAFCGMVGNFSTAPTAHIQSLWIAAYMAGKLGRDPAAESWKDDVRYQTLLHNRFGRWRYPVDWGCRAPSFVFDAVPYFDMLLRDLGLGFKRKGSFLSDIFAPYDTNDYEGVVTEWMSENSEQKTD